jgi:homoserine dehydrogenase
MAGLHQQIVRADLALIGFGHVGRRFAGLLDETREELLERGLDCRVVGISTARHGAAWDPRGIDTAAAIARAERGEPIGSAGSGTVPATSFEVIDRLGLSGTQLRVVIETTPLDIAAGQPAIDHVRAGFAAGCDVVTANKGPAAFEYASLRAAAESAGVLFLFEGAVMDGVPIFNLVRETLPAVAILGFRGVVNSTTNHILSVLEDGGELGPALARMQSEGIAEADASLDLEGWDAAAKTAALVNVLMHGRITPQGVVRTGIGVDSAEAARRAKVQGRRLRLVASAARRPDGGIDAAVAPTELPAGELLAGLRGQANALILRTDMLGELAICQLDGGLTQTAYALLTDLVTIGNCRRAPPVAPGRQNP